MSVINEVTAKKMSTDQLRRKVMTAASSLGIDRIVAAAEEASREDLLDFVNVLNSLSDDMPIADDDDSSVISAGVSVFGDDDEDDEDDDESGLYPPSEWQDLPLTDEDEPTAFFVADEDSRPSWNDDLDEAIPDDPAAVADIAEIHESRAARRAADKAAKLEAKAAARELRAKAKADTKAARLAAKPVRESKIREPKGERKPKTRRIANEVIREIRAKRAEEMLSYAKIAKWLEEVHEIRVTGDLVRSICVFEIYTDVAGE
jgi:hypothetical protein